VALARRFRPPVGIFSGPREHSLPVVANPAQDSAMARIKSAPASTSAPAVSIAYFFETYSSWCHWAEPAWAELRARYVGRVSFDWRVALMRPEDFPCSRAQCDWFYRRSGTVVGSPVMLHSGWVEDDRAAYVIPNLVAEAARDFLSPGDDRARLALARAALLDGMRLGDPATAVRVAVAASDGALSTAKLLSAAASAAIRARVEASTAEFHSHRITQRPAFVLTSEIGDKIVLSGVWRVAPLAAALDSLLADAAAYSSYRAHHGMPPATG
jgi:predicted DsbA family dithiol-disulfide isomerase